MDCYLCGSVDFKTRNGAVRDAANLRILECCNCGLVFLESFDHITHGYYAENPIVGPEVPSVDYWLKLAERDDQRRYKMLHSAICNKSLMDFGCGAGGFLRNCKGIARSVIGIEAEKKVNKYWGSDICIYPDLEAVEGERFDIITAFHVVEHLHDPKALIMELLARLDENGRLVIEVPSASDVLLTLYDVKAFQEFSYWSQHLFLFNANSLQFLARQSGARILAIKQCQRYPLSNHLYWLSQGRPGGHQQWTFLDSPELDLAYENSLAKLSVYDSLVAYLEPER